MSSHGMQKYLVALLLLGFSCNGGAVSFGTPPGGVFGEDIDGNGLFIPGNQVLSIELFDLVDLLTLIDPATYAFTGFEFGFYYNGNTEDRNAIFDILDFTVPGDVSQYALIDFNSAPGIGAILDLDTPLLSTTFASQGIATPIGFYLQLTLLNPVTLQVTPFGDPIYTASVENPGGVDLAGTFPVIGAPGNFGIGFILPLDLGTDEVALIPLAGYTVGPVSPVPVPGALGLWLLGLGALAAFRRWVGSRGRSAVVKPSPA